MQNNKENVIPKYVISRYFGNKSINQLLKQVALAKVKEAIKI